MKLIVKKYIGGNICSVENITRYTQREKNPVSEKKLEELVAGQNASNNTVQFEIVEIPEDGSSVCEIIQMLLGEKQYRRSYELGDLYESINEFKEQLEDFQSDVRDMISPIEYLAEQTKTVVDKLKKQL